MKGILPPVLSWLLATQRSGTELREAVHPLYLLNSVFFPVLQLDYQKKNGGFPVYLAINSELKYNLLKYKLYSRLQMLDGEWRMHTVIQMAENSMKAIGSLII